MKTVHFLYFVFVFVFIVAAAGVFSCESESSDDEVVKEESEWKFKKIEGVGDVGSFNSFVLDADDAAHVSYFDADNMKIKYATNESGQWETEEIPAPQDAAGDNSIGIDPSGNVHIVFCGSGLWYTSGSFGNWSAPTHPEAEGGCNNDVAIQDDGTVHISYTTNDGGTKNLIYQERPGDGSIAQIITVETGDIGATAIVIDDVGFPFIAFEKGGKLMYAEIAGTTWSSIEVDTGSVGSHLDMDMTKNIPRIAYSGGSNLKYAEATGGEWATETVDDSAGVGAYPSIALDSGNVANISYSGTGKVFFATNHAAVWEHAKVRSGLGSGELYTSVAVDSKDFIHIVFYSNDGHDLWYAVSKKPNESLDL